MIFLSASVWQILALGIDAFHTNQCIIMQQEFAREFGEISPSICSFGVDEPLVSEVYPRLEKKYGNAGYLKPSNHLR